MFFKPLLFYGAKIDFGALCMAYRNEEAEEE
jgi:hypothetical protein